MSPEAQNLPPDQVRLAESLTELDSELAALRARFDQYFLGLDRKHPAKELEDYRKRLLKMKGEFIRNTGLKFRVQSLWQKFQSYERMWVKSLKEIEEGTYHRDLYRLRRKNQLREQQPPKPATQAAEEKPPEKKKDAWELEDLEADLPADLFDEPAPKPAVAPPVAAQPKAPAKPAPAVPPLPQGARPPPPPPESSAPAPAPRAAAPLPRQPTNPPPPPPDALAPPAAPKPAARPPPPPAAATRPAQPAPARPAAAAAPAARPPPPPPGAADGLSTEKIQRIYDAFVTAKKRCKESTDGLTLEAVASSLRKQVPALMKEHNAKSVDFKVVITNGKAVLKAVPK